MNTHRLTVPIFDGTQHRKAGEEVAYSGKPSWKYQPLDPAARSLWEVNVWPKRPDHADDSILRSKAGFSSEEEIVEDYQQMGLKAVPVTDRMRSQRRP